jgi:hypothetical protein
MNLGYSDLAYIEEDVPILGLDHFVDTHILHEEHNYSIYMLYGRKVIQLPNPALRLYSCERLTLQFDQMDEAHHNRTTSHSRVSAYGGSTADHDYNVG